MGNLTASQVENALEETYLLDDGWDELGWYADYKKVETLSVEGYDYDFEVLEQDGEGSWSYSTSVVFRVGDQFFRKTGHYQSHYGNDWDGPLTEVKPSQKTVTVWEAK